MTRRLLGKLCVRKLGENDMNEKKIKMILAAAFSCCAVLVVVFVIIKLSNIPDTDATGTGVKVETGEAEAGTDDVKVETGDVKTGTDDVKVETGDVKTGTDDVTTGTETCDFASVILPRTSVVRERDERESDRPVNWREDDVTSGTMAESEQETMLVWASQTTSSRKAKEEMVSILRHSSGLLGPASPTTRTVATRLPQAS